ncbi:hypothetical protein D3C72_1099440 [compost metagenome]
MADKALAVENKCRLLFHPLRLHIRKGGLRRAQAVRLGNGIDLGDQIARSYRLSERDLDGGDAAGGLRADGDEANGFQRSRRQNRLLDIAARHRRGDVAGCGGARILRG